MLVMFHGKVLASIFLIFGCRMWRSFVNGSCSVPNKGTVFMTTTKASCGVFGSGTVSMIREVLLTPYANTILGIDRGTFFMAYHIYIYIEGEIDRLISGSACSM